MVELRAKPVISGPVRQSPLLKQTMTGVVKFVTLLSILSGWVSSFFGKLFLFLAWFSVSALFVSPVRYRLCRHEGGQVRVMSAASLTFKQYILMSSGCWMLERPEMSGCFSPQSNIQIRSALRLLNLKRVQKMKSKYFTYRFLWIWRLLLRQQILLHLQLLESQVWDPSTASEEQFWCKRQSRRIRFWKP